MAGHSKWANIKHKKGKTDAARGKVFTKLAKAITVAARDGGDPEMNFSLRLAIDKAKAENMPKDNIERAVQRGTGDDKDAAEIVTINYEGYGPGGVAVIVECLTDNTNRAVSDVKHIFSKYNGSLGSAGSVQWQFEQMAVVLFTTEKKDTIKDWDTFELALIDAGATDILLSEDGVEVRAPKEQFKAIIDVIVVAGITPDESGLMWIPNESFTIDEKTSEKMQTLYTALDDHDDVNEIYTNQA